MNKIERQIIYTYPIFSNVLFKLKNTIISKIIFSNKIKFISVESLLLDNYSTTNQKQFNNYALKSFSIHWNRVCFRGKGFRLRKFKKYGKISMNFGHSHWAKILISNFFFFKKLKRQNYMCLVKSYEKLKYFKFYIKFIKKLNKYTKRGLRLKKQYIQRRFGKISQVVSSLH